MNSECIFSYFVLCMIMFLAYGVEIHQHHGIYGLV